MFIISLILCGFCSAYSQNNDLIEKISKQRRAIDSLQIDIDALEQHVEDLQPEIKKLKKDLSKLQKNKLQPQKTKKIKPKKIEAQNKKIKIQNDRIEQLSKDYTTILNEMRNQINRKDTLINVTNFYENKPFDYLVKASTKDYVQRDLQLVGNHPIKQVLFDLEQYFYAKELLDKKFNDADIKEALNNLNKIEQESKSLEDLKKNIKEYEALNEQFKKMINKIIEIDEDFKNVSTPGNFTKMRKVGEIYTALFYFISFNQFNFIDYPYLSKILLKIIDLKRSDIDAKISLNIEVKNGQIEFR